MIYVKKYATENGVMLAMCDADLIDKVLAEGDLEMDMRAYAGFYKGDLIDPKNAKRLIDAETIHSANVVGKESVDAAIASSIIQKGHVKTIGDVPYAQAYSTKY
jgi:hypothetical protein